MANLRIDDDNVTVELSTAEKVEAVHGDVIVPRRSIVSVRVVDDAMAEVRGLRAPGTGLPGVIMVGTWRDLKRTTFAVCHGRGPGVVLELVDGPFDRIVITAENPDDALAGLG
jgi:hypothetical protein